VTVPAPVSTMPVPAVPMMVPLLAIAPLPTMPFVLPLTVPVLLFAKVPVLAMTPPVEVIVPVLVRLPVLSSVPVFVSEPLFASWPALVSVLLLARLPVLAMAPLLVETVVMFTVPPFVSVAPEATVTAPVSVPAFASVPVTLALLTVDVLPIEPEEPANSTVWKPGFGRCQRARSFEDQRIGAALPSARPDRTPPLSMTSVLVPPANLTAVPEPPAMVPKLSTVPLALAGEQHADAAGAACRDHATIGDRRRAIAHGDGTDRDHRATGRGPLAALIVPLLTRYWYRTGYDARDRATVGQQAGIDETNRCW